LCATNSTGFFVFFAAGWIHILRCGVLLFMMCGKKRIRYLRCAFLYCGVLLLLMMCRKKGLDVWVGWESFSDIQSSLLLDRQLLCRTIYNMCTQKPPQDYSQQLYDRYRESFEEYINSMVCKEHARFYFIFLLPLWLCYHAFGDPRWWWSVVSPRSFSLESCVNKFELICFSLRKSWTSVDLLRNPNLEDAQLLWGWRQDSGDLHPDCSVD
jgi:hypothetical protein